MKRTLFSSLALLTVLLIGMAVSGCNGHSSHEHGSGDKNTPEHQHSH